MKFERLLKFLIPDAADCRAAAAALRDEHPHLTPEAIALQAVA